MCFRMNVKSHVADNNVKTSWRPQERSAACGDGWGLNAQLANSYKSFCICPQVLIKIYRNGLCLCLYKGGVFIRGGVFCRKRGVLRLPLQIGHIFWLITALWLLDIMCWCYSAAYCVSRELLEWCQFRMCWCQASSARFLHPSFPIHLPVFPLVLHSFGSTHMHFNFELISWDDGPFL